MTIFNRLPWAAWLLCIALMVFGLEFTTATPVPMETDDVGPTLGQLFNRAKVWQPSVGVSWQIVLLNPIKVGSGSLSPDVRVWDLDLYDNSAQTFATLRKKNKKVICYFSAGSWEAWRSDATEFKQADLGDQINGWPRERWLDIRSTNVRNIMKKRIALAARKGCDALDPDNINGYQNGNGFNLTESNAVNYIKFLSKIAASYGMGIGLKNSPSIIPQVINHVHFAVVESCSQYSECGLYQPFIKAKKPVFEIEYPPGAGSRISDTTMKSICPSTTNIVGNQGFSVVIKNITLDGWTQYCGNSKVYTTLTIPPKAPAH